MTLLDSSNLDAEPRTQSRSVLLLGLLAALLVTGLVFAGYSVLRKRHQQQVIASQQAHTPPSSEPTGPPKVQILVDDALMKGEQRLLGGTVKNISAENLSDLAVNLELIRRKDGVTERVSAPVEPKQLTPQQEGRYSLLLHAADYLSVRLAGVKSGTSPGLAFAAGAGQKRPPERLDAKTIIVGRANSSKGGFLNTPDNPGRVP